MVDGNDAFTTTRRGALKTGALGLGGLTGAIALGSSTPAAAAQPPTMETLANLAGVSDAEYFLRLDGVPGDSLDDHHPAWLDVASFSWGASNSSTVTGSGWSSSKANIGSLSMMTETGSAGPRLFFRTMSGKHSAIAVLEGVSQGDAPRTFLQLELKDVLVSSYQQSGSGSGGQPFDSFSLDFASIKYTIYLQDSTGGQGEAITGSWNLRTGTGSST